VYFRYEGQKISILCPVSVEIRELENAHSDIGDESGKTVQEWTGNCNEGVERMEGVESEAAD
jgi:hypothetical protein